MDRVRVGGLKRSCGTDLEDSMLAVVEAKGWLRSSLGNTIAKKGSGPPDG